MLFFISFIISFIILISIFWIVPVIGPIMAIVFSLLFATVICLIRLLYRAIFKKKMVHRSHNGHFIINPYIETEEEKKARVNAEVDNIINNNP